MNVYPFCLRAEGDCNLITHHRPILDTTPSFFDLGERPAEGRWNDEGHGLFVQGNLLCVHRMHAPAALRRVVWSSAASLLGFVAGCCGSMLRGGSVDAHVFGEGQRV